MPRFNFVSNIEEKQASIGRGVDFDGMEASIDQEAVSRTIVANGWQLASSSHRMHLE